MATRLTYTTGSRSAELDRAFETALADARAAERERRRLPPERVAFLRARQRLIDERRQQSRTIVEQ
jgi:hypothetical protein